MTAGNRAIWAGLLVALLGFAPAWAADNIGITVGSGTTLKTKDVGGGVEESQVLLSDTSGTSILGTAGTANANVVTVQGIASGTPEPISAASLPLPTGASTSALQTTGNTTLTTINTTLGSPIQATGGTVGVVAGTAIIGKTGIDQTTDGSTNAVTIKPTATAGAGIAPVVSGSAESSHVFKGGAGNFYSAYVTTGATAGFLLIADAATAQSNGAITPIHCIQVAANSSASISTRGGPPDVFATGITALFSTTGCFTLTLSATAFFEGDVK